MRIQVLALLILSAILTRSHSVEDPELQQCKQLCQQQQQFDQPLKRECLRLCEDYAKRKAAREREAAAGSQEEPETERDRCKHQCRLAEQEEKLLGVCEHQCDERYEEKKKEKEGGGGRDGEDPGTRRRGAASSARAGTKTNGGSRSVRWSVRRGTRRRGNSKGECGGHCGE